MLKKRLLWIVLSGCSLFLFIWAYAEFNNGRYSIISTLNLYVLLAWLTGGLTSILRKKYSNKEWPSGLRISGFTLLVLLFLSELFFRFGIRTQLTYSEKNGQFYHYSNYQEDVRESSYRKKNFPPELRRYKIGLPDSTVEFVTDEFSIPHQFNSLGLRERDLSHFQDTSAFLILGIGDSFTEGVGSSEDSTWLRCMEHTLNTRDSLPRLLTFNAGYRGSDPVWEASLLEYLIPQLQPDMVILSISNSDPFDLYIRGGKERFGPDHSLHFRNSPFWAYVYGISPLFRQFAARAGMNEMGVWAWQWEDRTEEGRKILYQSIEEDYLRLSREHGFELIVVMVPSHWGIRDEQYQLATEAQTLKAMNTFEVIDLWESFHDSGKITPDNYLEYYWENDGHFKPKGYQLWGQTVADSLIARGLLPSLNNEPSGE